MLVRVGQNYAGLHLRHAFLYFPVLSTPAVFLKHEIRDETAFRCPVVVLAPSDSECVGLLRNEESPCSDIERFMHDIALDME